MISKKYIFVIVLIMNLNLSYAQNYIDALRYSQQFYSTTAKSDAMGNSLSALGADMSALSINPAGLAVYKSAQFTLTPNFIINNAEGTFLGSSRTESKFGFTVSNIAYVGVIQSKNVFKTINFGLAYNSYNDYRKRTIVSGVNSDGSMLDYLVYNANSDRYSAFREDLAWRGWLLNYDTIQNEYYSYVTDDNRYGENQRNEVVTKGGAGEFVFTLGGNIADKLFLGMSVGFTSVNYREESVYSESDFPLIYAPDADNPGDSLLVNPNRFDYSQTLVSEGSGINGKFGFIYQPFKFLRVGGAIHTSTGYKFNDDYQTSMYVDYPVSDSNGYYNYEPDTANTFTWRLQTPFRANLGAAFIFDSHQIGKFFTVPMTLSIDYEYVDYSRAKMRSDYYSDYSFDNENYTITDLLQATHSIRAGAEFNFGFMKIRGGYAVYTSPYKGNADFFDGAKSIYSGGIGFAGEHSYIDFSYSYSKSDETMYLYNASTVFPYDPIGGITEPTASVNNVKQFIKVTLGLRF